jgi:acyl carrier protein
MSNKVAEIEGMIKEKLKIDKIDRKATLADYGLDSLDVVEFILDLEEKYNVTFEAQETKDLKTVGDLLDLVEKKIN